MLHWRVYAAALAVLVPRVATAAEGEWQIGAGLGADLLVVEGEASVGATLDADGVVGLTDSWGLLLSASAATHATSYLETTAAAGNAETSARDGYGATTFRGVVGARYTLDVTRLLPFAQIGLAVQGLLGEANRTTAGGESGRTDVGLELGLGADYLLNREWAMGVAATGLALPVQLSGGDGSSPVLSFALAVHLARLFL